VLAERWRWAARCQRLSTGHQLSLADADPPAALDGLQPLLAADRTGAIDPKQAFTLPIPGPSRRQEVPLVRVGVIGGLESVVDITCQPRRAVLLIESLL
jgi:hypothetical protein